MQIVKAEFKCSSQRLSQIPDDDLREFAFIGRSNVGKSSLINMLTNHAGLAKVSGTPGKTQLINHFLINKQWYLVDLPGYGYARTSKSRRESFAKIITQYVTKARKLHLLFVLIDSRLEPQRIDIEFLEMLGENGIPFAIVFTKADKLSKAQLKHSVARFEARVLEMWEEMPPSFVTSSSSKMGREEILGFISQVMNDWSIQKDQQEEADEEDTPSHPELDSGSQTPTPCHSGLDGVTSSAIN